MSERYVAAPMSLAALDEARRCEKLARCAARHADGYSCMFEDGHQQPHLWDARKESAH